jgi:hypothetical protein
MDPTPLLPYFIGLVPILFARSWRARIVAILFGLVSMGFGAYYVWSIQHSANVSSTVQQAGRSVIGALSNAIVSAIVTYLLDKKEQDR